MAIVAQPPIPTAKTDVVTVVNAETGQLEVIHGQEARELLKDIQASEEQWARGEYKEMGAAIEEIRNELNLPRHHV